jgi:hypothetical protein
MRAVGIVVCSLGAAAALQPALCPTVRVARGNALTISCSAVDRRSAVLGALSWGLLAAPALAYDAIPEVAADFEALEKARAIAAAGDKIKTKELNAKVAKIESASTPQEFVAAADGVRAPRRTAAHPPRARRHGPGTDLCCRALADCDLGDRQRQVPGGR